MKFKPERMPSLSFCQIKGSLTFIEVDGTLIPIQNSKVATGTINVQSSLTN